LPAEHGPLRAGAPSWWADKSRQAIAHLRAHVDPAERAELASWLRPEELALFDAMHVADRRHGLDVVAWLREDQIGDRDVLVAGLLHDCAKGDTGLGPRVAYSLGERYGPRIWRLAAVVPGWAVAVRRLREHAEASARLAAAAGCPPRTVELIRNQADPVDPDAGERLRLADEAS
jgi:hypothetical protein